MDAGSSTPRQTRRSMSSTWRVGTTSLFSRSLAQDSGGYPRFSNDGGRILFMEWSPPDESLAVRRAQ